ncbi:beta-ketoacyl-ACP synthase II [bacterium]|nr:beta-ketoacyl-ACP synthase II [bacterium]
MADVSKQRIVITGMGIVSPVGIGLDAFWTGLLTGRSGAGPISRFDASEHKTQFACEVKDFDPKDYMDRKMARRMDPFCQFAVAASGLAVNMAGLTEGNYEPDRVGVVYGSGIGGLTTYEPQVNKLAEAGPGKVSPFVIPMLIGDIAAGYISMIHQFKGPNYSVQSACATASNSIGVAAMHLLLGDSDIVVCGGAEAPLTPTGVAGFNAAMALSTRNDDPMTASRPFDKNRDGFVMAEGGATFILETEEHARARGAEILAELAGYGFSGDAYHLTAPAPHGEGAVRSMRAAIRNAGLTSDDIDYINAHGTSTAYNDSTETEAIKTVFGDRAYKIPISSTKSSTGHLLGAAGGVELAACVQSIRTGKLAPTINYETPDPDCDLDYVPNTPREADVEVALSNTFGFGGHNATLVVRRYQA